MAKNNNSLGTNQSSNPQKVKPKKKPALPSPPKLDPTVQAADITSRRARAGVIWAAVIALSGSILTVWVAAWVSERNSPPGTNTGIYQVRVTVLDEQGRPTEKAELTSTFGGEAKKVKGGWQFDIPVVNKPKDGKLTMIATQETAFLKGEETLTLGKEMTLAVTIKMKTPPPDQVRGQVVDAKNRAMVGATVLVVGYGSEALTTREGGNFVLPAHAAIGQQVLLHAEKNGLTAKLWHPAGETPAILILKK